MRVLLWRSRSLLGTPQSCHARWPRRTTCWLSPSLHVLPEINPIADDLGAARVGAVDGAVAPARRGRGFSWTGTWSVCACSAATRLASSRFRSRRSRAWMHDCVSAIRSSSLFVVPDPVLFWDIPGYFSGHAGRGSRIWPLQAIKTSRAPRCMVIGSASKPCAIALRLPLPQVHRQPVQPLERWADA